MPLRAVAVLLLLSACVSPMQTATRRSDALRDDDPDLAAAYDAMRRAGTDDLHRSYAVARAAMRRMNHHSTVAADAADAFSDQPFGRWRFLGPGNVGGRTRVVLIDPVEPNVMYAAGVSGGIWKSRSAGTRWEPVGDDLMNVAVNAMALRPTDRNVLYAGTGEGYFREEQRGTALPLRGNGIFVSRDGAATWTQLASTANEDFQWVNDLAVSTHDPSRIYAATRSGVWRSVDAGITWKRVLPATVKGGCLDLAYRGDRDGDFFFAACGTFEQATIYRAVHAESEAPWDPVLSEPNMGRTTLAIAPSRPATMYALSASNEPGLETYQAMLAVWRSDRDGEAGSWFAQVTNESTDDLLGPLLLTNPLTVSTKICDGKEQTPVTMGWYCNTIAVDPADPERVWVGGVDLFRSDDGGRTWGQASYWWAENQAGAPFVHADQHAITFHPHYDGTTNRIAYFGNDGGVFRTDDARGQVLFGRDAICVNVFPTIHFEPLNFDYGVTQFYHGAVMPDGRTFLGGAQDNGTVRGTFEEGPNLWKRVVGGDGGYVAIDADPNIVYAESQNGNVVRSADGGRNFSFFRDGIADSFLFVAPLAADPRRPLTAWLGGAHMWRVSHGERWDRASAAFGAAGLASAIAIAPDNSDRVLAGTNRGYILRTNIGTRSTAQTAWTSTRPREGFVSSLAFDPGDTSVVYATYAGFGGTHVWLSIDGGATWTPRDGEGNGALPDMPVHSLAVDPTRRERLYLGTDLGVFVSLDSGAHWSVENSGFAAVVTEAVFIAPGALGPAVYAFTHGRGAWRAELTLNEPRRRGVRH
jgi:photosystem II stability/assembly factor-like uncharacterized protein